YDAGRSERFLSDSPCPAVKAVRLELPPDLHRELRSEAAKQGNRRSALARGAVEEYLGGLRKSGGKWPCPAFLPSISPSKSRKPIADWSNPTTGWLMRFTPWPTSWTTSSAGWTSSGSKSPRVSGHSPPVWIASGVAPNWR